LSFPVLFLFRSFASEINAMISLQIPVKAHVYKYLISQFGLSMTLTKSNAVGLLLTHLLKRNTKHKQYDYVLQSYEKSYSVQIPKGFVFDRGVRYLSTYSVMQLNNFVDDLIKAQFYTFMELHLAAGIMRRDAIIKFRERYGFEEDDLAFETLKKAYYRHERSQRALDVPVNPMSHATLPTFARTA
jgi:hypothetical protein